MRSSLLLCAALASAMLLSCDEDERGPEYTIIADQIPGGVPLAMASVGEEVVLVGGQLDGGASVIVHYKDDELCYEEAPTERALWWIHSARPGEWYAVGEAGTILHEVNGVRTDESVPTDAVLYGVFDAGDRVIAVGGALGRGLGEAWIKEGDTWSLLAGSLPGVAFKAFGNWIVGDGIAYFVEGRTLEARFPPAGTKLLTVTGRDQEDVYAVGGSATAVMLHWNGSDWDAIDIDPFCATQGLNGVFTGPGEDVWLAGFFGAMGALEAGGEWNCPSQLVTFEHFHTVNKHGDDLLWAGGNMFDVGGNYGTLARYGERGGARRIVATACP